MSFVVCVLSFLVCENTIILICVKNTTMVAKLSEVTTTRVWLMSHVVTPIGKMKTPLRKELLLAPIKKIATLLFVLTFIHKLCLHAYHPISNVCYCCTLYWLGDILKLSNANWMLYFLHNYAEMFFSQMNRMNKCVINTTMIPN